MPVIIQSQDTLVKRQGEGWAETLLADRESFGHPAMVASRLSFQARAVGPQDLHGHHEQLLYIISGSGTARVNGEDLPLEPETMLWLEPGDRYQFLAGPRGLEILRGYAPGE